MNKKNLLCNLTLLFVVMVAASCGKRSEEPKVSAHKTMEVSVCDRVVETSYPATFKGVHDVDIYPQVSGLISMICINEGDKVKKGQTLFVVDRVPYEAALKKALADVESAEAAVETAIMTADGKKLLYEDSVVSDFELRQSLNDLKQKRAALAQARAQLVDAQNNLSYTEVKSPVDGIAGMTSYRIGSLVGPSMSNPLVSVSDNDEIYAYFSLTEKQFLNLSQQNGGGLQGILKNTPYVELQLSDGTRYSEKGEIDAVSGMIDPSTGAVRLRAVFKNKNNLLLSGGSGNVILSNKIEGCVVVPQEATYELQDKVFVYRVVHGRAKSTRIKVCPLDNGKEYIVEEGLKVGDVIVAEGAGLIKEDTPVGVNK
ncbi:MAG: efflux RND transporter periplasmic adaptor subunit [Bacteroidaceae bacterium]